MIGRATSARSDCGLYRRNQTLAGQPQLSQSGIHIPLGNAHNCRHKTPGHFFLPHLWRKKVTVSILLCKFMQAARSW